MAARIYCPAPLAAGAELRLPDGAARHVQVLRHQPGDALTLFNGEGGEWLAEVVQMGKSHVDVRVLRHDAVEREITQSVHLWVGLTANERMDWLVEKATELGVASITPVQAERSVLRLKDDRAQKRQAHWQAIAQAACEQCGRNRVPLIHPVSSLSTLLVDAGWGTMRRAVLSLADGAQQLTQWCAPDAQAPRRSWVLLSGPEGGLSEQEDALARAKGMQPVQLGARVLRAETAPLAVLSHIGFIYG